MAGRFGERKRLVSRGRQRRLNPCWTEPLGSMGEVRTSGRRGASGLTSEVVQKVDGVEDAGRKVPAFPVPSVWFRGRTGMLPDTGHDGDPACRRGRVKRV